MMDGGMWMMGGMAPLWILPLVFHARNRRAGQISAALWSKAVFP